MSLRGIHLTFYPVSLMRLIWRGPARFGRSFLGFAVEPRPADGRSDTALSEIVTARNVQGTVNGEEVHLTKYGLDHADGEALRERG